jgi:hypothetical protein
LIKICHKENKQPTAYVNISCAENEEKKTAEVVMAPKRSKFWFLLLVCSVVIDARRGK